MELLLAQPIAQIRLGRVQSRELLDIVLTAWNPSVYRHVWIRSTSRYCNTCLVFRGYSGGGFVAVGWEKQWLLRLCSAQCSQFSWNFLCEKPISSAAQILSVRLHDFWSEKSFHQCRSRLAFDFRVFSGREGARYCSIIITWFPLTLWEQFLQLLISKCLKWREMELEQAYERCGAAADRNCVFPCYNCNVKESRVPLWHSSLSVCLQVYRDTFKLLWGL